LALGAFYIYWFAPTPSGQPGLADRGPLFFALALNLPCKEALSLMGVVFSTAPWWPDIFYPPSHCARLLPSTSSHHYLSTPPAPRERCARPSRSFPEKNTHRRRDDSLQIIVMKGGSSGLLLGWSIEIPVTMCRLWDSDSPESERRQNRYLFHRLFLPMHRAPPVPGRFLVLSYQLFPNCAS